MLDTRVPTMSTDSLLLVVDDGCGNDAGAVYNRLTQWLERRLQIKVELCTLATPPHTVAVAIASAMTAGQRRVVVVPLVVGVASPVLADLAGVLRWAHTRMPSLGVALAEPLGTPLHVTGWLAHRARTALAQLSNGVLLADTALLVVGQGCGEPLAHAEVYQIARLLWEGRDYGFVEVAFAQGAAPGIADGLHRCMCLGARRIVVLPLTLLPGPAYDSIRDHVQVAQIHAPACEVVLAEPLLSVASGAAAIEQRLRDALRHWSMGGGNGLLPLHTHVHSDADGAAYAPTSEAVGLLPPRYQKGAPASTAPMAAAPLQYDADGRVAWNQVWTAFCELALAGGPPHRGTLLEPVTPDQVRADPNAYQQVLAELARGLQMVTGLPVVCDAPPGWIGIMCSSEEMALWLLRTIVVENISVRREDTTLFLPAGPAFRVEHEIKNIVTTLAKTYHYWTEHQAARFR